MAKKKAPAPATASYLILEPNGVMLPGEVGYTILGPDAAYFGALEKGGFKVFMPASDEPGDIGTIGTVALADANEKGVKIKITAEGRGRLHSRDGGGDVEYAEVEAVETPADIDMALVVTTFDKFKNVFEGQIQPERLEALEDLAEEKPAALADKMMNFMQLNGLIEGNAPGKWELLQTADPEERLIQLREILDEVGLAKETLEKAQQQEEEFFLRQQLDIIREKLGEGRDAKLEKLAKAIAESGMPEAIRAQCEKELDSIRDLSASDQTANVTRKRLETIAAWPWNKFSETKNDLNYAEEILNADHYGMEEVKQKILKHIAVQQRTGDGRGKIILLAGNPGTGKTTIAASIAKALGRKLGSVAMGGVSIEAAIRGHNPSFVSAGPGEINKAVMETGTLNPVILLDEIDKMGESKENGSPEAALLQVLDKEQNKAFKDHFMDIDVDLSDVVFLATANDLRNISGPLLNRMDLIIVDDYYDDQKTVIARRYLLKNLMADKKLTEGQFSISDAALARLIDGYTREAGVRELEMKLSDLMDDAVLQINKDHVPSVAITPGSLEKCLGPAPFERKMVDPEPEEGHVNGLAVSGGVTGEVMPLEAVMFKAGAEDQVEAVGNMELTMSQSVQNALAFVKSKANELGITEETYLKNKLHIMAGRGGVNKDGPSAGLAFATLIVSVWAHIPIRGDIAMTGEISAKGKSRAIGGLEYKLDGAFKQGIKTVLIPEENRKDIVDDPKFPQALREKLFIADPDADPRAEVPEGMMRVIPVKNAMEVFRHALEWMPEPLTAGQIFAQEKKNAQGNMEELANLISGALAKVFAPAAAVVQPAPANDSTRVPQPAPAVANGTGGLRA